MNRPTTPVLREMGNTSKMKDFDNFIVYKCKINVKNVLCTYFFVT